MFGFSANNASRSFRDNVSSTHGVIVRMVASDGRSDVKSDSPKNSPSVRSAIRKSLPCTPLLNTSTCPCAITKNLLRSSPSTSSLFPIGTFSTRKDPDMRSRMVSGNRENNGTRRRALAGNDTPSSRTSTAIRSALASSTLVRLTR